MKNCPKCHKQLMQELFKSLKVDSCQSCGGLWFDKDELRLAKDRTDDDLRWLDFDLFRINNEKKLDKDLMCPLCNINLNETKYQESNIRVDICDKCQGVWLDKNELDRILRFLENKLTSISAKNLSSLSIEEFREIFTGPETKSSEIRDFISIINLLQLRYQVENPWVINASQAVYQTWPLK